jgi:signal transduction histidine kinase
MRCSVQALHTKLIKYSPNADRVVIATNTNKKEIKLCVEDFGIGIPTSQQSKLFTRFFRVSHDTSNTFPGLGLGLFISSEIIKRHSGNINFKSTEGEGSTFCFSLPVDNK